jgi:predicted O-methyltransferase YrrM
MPWRDARQPSPDALAIGQFVFHRAFPADACIPVQRRERTVLTADYREFFELFGASCRRKHVSPGFPRSLAASMRGALSGKSAKGTRVRRPYPLPSSSGLPRDFIRLDPWEMDYLFALAASARRGILETGRFNGGSLFLMAWANRQAPLFSIDIAPQDDERLREYFRRFQIGSNVTLIVGDSQHARDPQVGPVDLLFVDGDHSYAGCLNDLTNWWPLVVPGGHVVVHDCYAGSEVQPATIDFIDNHEVVVVQPPFIHSVHLNNACGSLAHFRKPLIAGAELKETR